VGDVVYTSMELRVEVMTYDKGLAVVIRFIYLDLERSVL
jgi:hypothetical protein